jgi:hypothetical protein
VEEFLRLCAKLDTFSPRRPEAFGIYLSLGVLPLEPQSEFTSQLTLGGCAAAGLTMHKMRAWCRTAAHDPNQD